MTRLLPLLAATLLMLGLAACGPGGPPQEDIVIRTHALASGAAVRIDVRRAQVSVSPGGGDMVEIEARLLEPARTDFSIVEEAEELLISAHARGGSPLPVRITVQVPAGTAVHVRSFDGEIVLRDLAGEIRVESVAADISAENLSGSARLQTGRGDVTVAGSTGSVQLVGEHGILSIAGSGGDIRASTIMGTIRFRGELTPDNSISLESDHGPVEIVVSGEPDAVIGVTSNSGHVTCTVPGLSGTMSRCSGVLGGGQGTLTVRTVSGNVTIRPAY